MSFISLGAKREARLQVRPVFVLVVVAFLIVLILPAMIEKRPLLQRATLALVTATIGSAWFLLLRYPEPNNSWRAWLSFLTAAYLTLSIPAVFFEIAQWKWLRHPLASLYVRPWVHWGYALMCLGILGSFCARGRARVMLVVGSIILIALRVSIGTWVF